MGSLAFRGATGHHFQLLVANHGARHNSNPATFQWRANIRAYEVRHLAEPPTQPARPALAKRCALADTAPLSRGDYGQTAFLARRPLHF